MEMLIYLAKASLYGLLMWGIYCIVWRGRPWHAASRTYLLMSMVLPFVLPLIHLKIRPSSPVPAYGFCQPGMLGNAANNTGPDKLVSLSGLALYGYALMVIIVAGFYIAAYLRLLQKLRRGEWTNFDGYSIITHTGVGPGTIGTRVFFPEAALDNAILNHELAHIRAGHRFDSVVMQLMHIFFWISPALWLIGRELKTVHEFEADALVLRHTDARVYTSLLLSRAFGISQLNIAHSFFHHPLKRRIIMLQQTERSRIAKRTFFSSLLLTAALCGIVLIAQAEKNAPAAKKTDPAPKAETSPFHGNEGFLPDGRRIYTSVNQLHKWPVKFKKGQKGGGC